MLRFLRIVPPVFAGWYLYHCNGIDTNRFFIKAGRAIELRRGWSKYLMISIDLIQLERIKCFLRLPITNKA